MSNNYVKTWKGFLNEGSFTSSMYELIREEVELVSEGRKEDAMKKYGEALGPEVIDVLSKNDPSKNNKYLMWMAKELASNNNLNPEKVLALASAFHEKSNRMQKKDINSYKSASELETALNSIGQSKKQKKEKVKEGAKKVHEDERFLIIRPETKEASCHYGKGTKWCIAATQDNYFSYYEGKGYTFYFVIDKTKSQTDDNYKIALAVGPDGKIKEYYDAADNKMSEGQLIDAWAGSVDYILKIVHYYNSEHPIEREDYSNYKMAILQELQNTYGLYEGYSYEDHLQLPDENIQRYTHNIANSRVATTMEFLSLTAEERMHSCNPGYGCIMEFKSDDGAMPVMKLLNKRFADLVERTGMNQRSEEEKKQYFANFNYEYLIKAKNLTEDMFRSSKYADHFRGILHQKYNYRMRSFNIASFDLFSFNCEMDLIHNDGKFDCGIGDDGQIDQMMVEDIADSIAGCKRMLEDKELNEAVITAITMLTNKVCDALEINNLNHKEAELDLMAAIYESKRK